MEKLYGGSNYITLPKKLEIPEIDDKRLKELYQLLKPIVTIDKIKYLLREFTLQELRNQSYIWNCHEDKRDVVDPSRLETVDDFLCLHTWGYYGLFKPSIAEVLSQAPESVILLKLLKALKLVKMFSNIKKLLIMVFIYQR